MMEEYMCEKKECCRKDKKKCMIDVVIFILAISLFFTIGLIVGALATTAITAALAAIIVLAVVLLLLLIIRIVMLICFNNKKC